MTPAGDPVHLEQIAWTPRSLKAAISQPVVPTASRVLGYDGAGRLTRSANLPEVAASLPNNATPPPGVFDEALSERSFAYDPAENLLARTTTESGIAASIDLPLDGSGRNRPGAIDGLDLGWDANGNLTSKGDLELHYDFRNRLTRVTRGGAELARYRYDAFNRKIETVSGGETRETVWSGWQPIETRGSDGFSTRRTYGVGLDEIVRQEVDVDGDGTAETVHAPVYDATGSLVAILDESGKPIERYEHSPYGERTIRADLAEPEIEQLRVVEGEVWIEVTERVSELRIRNLVATGEIRLENLSTSTTVPIAAVAQPVLSGLQAGRRVVFALEGAPAPGDAVRLVLPAGALADSFLNTNGQPVAWEWTWSGADGVIVDTRAPQVAEVRLRAGRVEIEWTEEVDPQSADPTVTIDGAQTGWELLPDR
ncbi:MAG: hypothetical protein K8I65_13555, partial [Thermoanaerobaculia bacterium]|nr:hypothetical protein [Thermoanaerobaculia bacterium]